MAVKDETAGRGGTTGTGETALRDETAVRDETAADQAAAAAEARRQGRGPEILAALWGFAESTLFFIVPDVLLTWLALSLPRRALRACYWALGGALAGGDGRWQGDPQRFLAAFGTAMQGLAAEGRFAAWQ